MKVRWRENAKLDLREIYQTIAQNNPPAARRVARAIRQETAGLAAHPFMGREGRIENTRELVIRRYPALSPTRSCRNESGSSPSSIRRGFGHSNSDALRDFEGPPFVVPMSGAFDRNPCRFFRVSRGVRSSDPVIPIYFALAIAPVLI